MLGDIGCVCGVVHGQPCAPLGISHDGGPELGISGQSCVVGSDRQQSYESQPLFIGDV